MTLSPRLTLLTLLSFGVLLAACRTEHSTPYPPPADAPRPLQVAQGSETVAGAYDLVGVGGYYLPKSVGMYDGCPVQLAGGTLELTADGRYRLALDARQVCGDPYAAGYDDARSPAAAAGQPLVKEGVYALRGNNIRFGDRIIVSRQQQAPEATSGATELAEAVFPYGRFSASGTVRHSELTVTLDDLKPLSFTRRGATPPYTVRPGAPVPMEAGPTGPGDENPAMGTPDGSGTGMPDSELQQEQPAEPTPVPQPAGGQP